MALADVSRIINLTPDHLAAGIADLIEELQGLPSRPAIERARVASVLIDACKGVLATERAVALAEATSGPRSVSAAEVGRQLGISGAAVSAALRDHLRDAARQPGGCEYCRVQPSEDFGAGCQDTVAHAYCGHCRTCLLCGRYWQQESRSSARWGYQETVAETEARLASEDAADPEYAELRWGFGDE
jgi:hypothetical protein